VANLYDASRDGRPQTAAQVLAWMPERCSELNAMDWLWKESKGDLAANRQFKNINETVDFDFAEQ